MKAFYKLFFTFFFLVVFGCNNRSPQKRISYTDFDKGYNFFYYGKYDSAFIKFTNYVNLPDDSLNKAKAYRYMGEILWRVGDLYGGQDYLNMAIHTLGSLNANKLLLNISKPERTAHSLDSLHSILQQELGAAYNISGNVYLDLKLYDDAIEDYSKAESFFKGSDYLPEILNGKALVYQKKRQFTKASQVYDSIALLKPEDPLLVARLTDNKAKTKWLQDPGYFALPAFWLALKIRTENGDTAGLNASYAHLSDYYQNSHPDSAFLYAQKMLERATWNNNPDDRIEAMDKLIRYNKTAGIKYKWYSEREKLGDSLRFARDTTKNRFGKIRYDFQQERTEKLLLQQHVARQVLVIYTLAIVAVIFITGLYIRYTKRRRLLKQETANAIRDMKLKTSQKVHDVVANSLYRIMNELEHTDSIDKESLLDNIEGLYEQSRDISYEDLSTGNSIYNSKKIHNLLTSFSNDKTNVFVIGGEHAFWRRITDAQKQELELILNELLVNMKKHSRAVNVVVAFKLDKTKAFISYKDDGVGFAAGIEFGNGLKNTVSRIKSLGGDIIFGKSEKAGVSIEMSFPLQPVKA